MQRKRIQRTCVLAGLTAMLVTVALAAKDRFTVVAANGITFAEFRGYDSWQPVAPSQTDDRLKVITANPEMIKAYQEGFPGNGKAVPDGAKFAKVEWTAKKDPESPYPVLVPDTLKRVGFMIKDSKRFPETDGWGYAQFVYDAASDTFTPETNDPQFGKKVCHSCHTLVTAKDFVFTEYPKW
ncbi:MAG TPA: cytochrome P460 family protein [Bryobacteraceae bacterium]|nr:cytochrome P460 family protein [Bryobacteraceae bacterium]